MTELRTGQHWRHKKRGSVYEIVATDCTMQCSSYEAWAMEEEMWVAYRSITGHQLHFRMSEEFLDGRFELVKDADA